MCYANSTERHALIFRVIPGTNPQWLIGLDLNNTSQLILSIAYWTDDTTPSNLAGYPAPVTL
jgi:hypothetical protein